MVIVQVNNETYQFDCIKKAIKLLLRHLSSQAEATPKYQQLTYLD